MADGGFWDYTMTYGPAGSEYYVASQVYDYATNTGVSTYPDGTGTTTTTTGGGSPPPSSPAAAFGAGVGAGIGKGIGDAAGTILIGVAVLAGLAVVVVAGGTAVYFGPEIMAALDTAKKVKGKR
jgi:hypothetical protein